jgi:hypothetical protein
MLALLIILSIIAYLAIGLVAGRYVFKYNDPPRFDDWTDMMIPGLIVFVWPLIIWLGLLYVLGRLATKGS